jgi:hypothetical protein
LFRLRPFRGAGSRACSVCIYVQLRTFPHSHLFRATSLNPYVRFSRIRFEKPVTRSGISVTCTARVNGSGSPSLPGSSPGAFAFWLNQSRSPAEEHLRVRRSLLRFIPSMLLGESPPAATHSVVPGLGPPLLSAMSSPSSFPGEPAASARCFTGSAAFALLDLGSAPRVDYFGVRHF